MHLRLLVCYCAVWLLQIVSFHISIPTYLRCAFYEFWDFYLCLQNPLLPRVGNLTTFVVAVCADVQCSSLLELLLGLRIQYYPSEHTVVGKKYACKSQFSRLICLPGANAKLYNCKAFEEISRMHVSPLAAIFKCAIKF